jgi:hypothetical protein
MGKMHAKLLLKNPTGRDQPGELGIDRRIILKSTLNI